MKGFFMNNTAFEKEITTMTDSELATQMGRAYEDAYYESFGSDHEARKQAIERYHVLAREWKERKRT